MSIPPVGSGSANLPGPQITIQKKTDLGFFQSYDLKVTINSKTVTVRMNTFKTPWGRKIFASNLLKKVAPGQVDSLMRAWVNSAIEIKKGPLREEAEVSIAAMKLFFSKYPASYHLKVQLSEFDPIFSETNVVKKEMALLYHELAQENPREEVIKKFAESISNAIEEIKQDKKLESSLLKSFKIIQSAIVGRGAALAKLNLGKGIEEEEYNELISSLEKDIAPHLHFLEGPKDLSTEQYNGVIKLLNQKMKGVVDSYKEVHEDIVSGKESAYEIASSEQERLQVKLGEARDLKKSQALEKRDEEYRRLMEIQENGVINQQNLSEISHLNESLGHLDQQIHELNAEVDKLVEDKRSTFKEIFNGLLEERSSGNEIKELVRDVGTLVTYPLQSAWVKLCRLKTRNHPLMEKFNVLKEQYVRISEQRAQLVEKRDIFYEQIGSMKRALNAECDLALERADEEYAAAVQDSMKGASEKYRNLSMRFSERELALKQQVEAFSPSFEKSVQLLKKVEDSEKNFTIFEQKSKVIEAELGVDFSALSDRSTQSLAALQLTVLCGLASLGIENT